MINKNEVIQYCTPLYLSLVRKVFGPFGLSLRSVFAWTSAGKVRQASLLICCPAKTSATENNTSVEV